MSKTFFFQQNDTKIKDFDEGVLLILEQFFWGNVMFKICSFCIKSHIWGREEFLWVAPPDCNAAKLRNECFSSFTLALMQWFWLWCNDPQKNIAYVFSYPILYQNA